eukprot:2152780-Amphidinium_carterae.2
MTLVRKVCESRAATSSTSSGFTVTDSLPLAAWKSKEVHTTCWPRCPLSNDNGKPSVLHNNTIRTMFVSLALFVPASVRIGSST